jgi:hypothetical protein
VGCSTPVQGPGERPPRSTSIPPTAGIRTLGKSLPSAATDERACAAPARRSRLTQPALTPTCPLLASLQCPQTGPPLRTQPTAKPPGSARFLSGGRHTTTALAWLRSGDRNEATEVWTVAASSSSAPSFADLTSAGQTRRLRRLAVSALEAYEVSVCGLVRLHGWNTTFRVDGPTGDRRVQRTDGPTARIPRGAPLGSYP